jgi:hypothetical protein
MYARNKDVTLGKDISKKKKYHLAISITGRVEKV